MEELSFLELNFLNQVRNFLSSQINVCPNIEHDINYKILMNPMYFRVGIDSAYVFYNAKIKFNEKYYSFVLEEENYCFKEEESYFSYSELNEVILNLQKFHEELLNLIDVLNRKEEGELHGR